VAIDSAGYGTVNVTQAVSIVAPLGVHAGISVFAGDGVTVNAGTGVVVLRNLFISSLGGTNGITLTAAAALHIENCVVSSFSNNDINLVPVGASVTVISDTIACGAGDAGVFADSASLLVISMIRCRLNLNLFGVLADRAAMTIRDSDADANASISFYARGSGGATSMAVESCSASNSSYGVAVNNGNVAVHSTSIFHNAFGAYAQAATGSGKMSVADCVITGTTGSYGVYVDIGGDVSVTNCTIADNANVGVLAADGGIVRLAHNTITRNAGGIVNLTSTVTSSGDNVVDGNSTETAGTAISIVTTM
jgi:hypothetical protein